MALRRFANSSMCTRDDYLGYPRGEVEFVALRFPDVEFLFEAALCVTSRWNEKQILSGFLVNILEFLKLSFVFAARGLC